MKVPFDFIKTYQKIAMRYLALMFIILSAESLFGQSDSLDLEKCRKLVITRYPLTSDMDRNLEASNLKIENIKAVYYPTLQLTGQFVHVADVPHTVVQNPLFSIPLVGKDQYKMLVEAKQIIYDGGLTKRRNDLESINVLTDNQDIQVKLYQLNDQVNELYFMILLFQEQNTLLSLTRINLQEQLKVVESGVKNGVLLPGDADVVKAEILKIDQRIIELESGKKSGIEMLSELMDSTLSENIDFVFPSYDKKDSESSVNRPEYKLLELQRGRIEKTDRLNKAYRFPYLGLFGQFGYGYPGMNMLEDKPNIIYSFGVSLSWNIWDWGKVKRESQINKISADKILTQKEIFDKNLNMAVTQELNKIKQFEESIKSDEEIIGLRERITSAKSSQLKNGVITSSDFIIEMNAETQAKINKQLHEIQLLKAIIRLNTLRGNINESAE